MDPNATIALLLEAIADRDMEEARGVLGDLAEWADKGGFLPTNRLREAATEFRGVSRS